MKSLKTLKNTVSKFASDRSGNFAMTFAAASTVLMLAAGLAVDFSHVLNIKTNLSSALDSAILSTAREIARGKVSESDAKAKVAEFLSANLNTNRVDPSKTFLTSFKLDAATNKISATATTTYKVAFPVFSVASSQSVSVKSAAAYTDRKVEVSMVLDVTSSMDDKNKGESTKKIDDLKVAAAAAVDAFINNGSDNARVAIVPYSAAVNSGVLSATVRDPRGVKPTADKCATERRGTHMFDDASPATAKVTRADEIGTKRYWVCPKAEVLPLTRDIAKLNSTISSLAAIGKTAGHIGIQWGWYMLSPNWKSALPATSTPVNYGTANTEKFLIIMTDGQFNTNFAGGAPAPTHSGITQMSGRYAMGYCDAIKASGIKVFTIGFDFDGIPSATERAEAIKTLQDCATAPKPGETTFFRAESRADLVNAYKSIAKRVERVILTD